MLPLRWLSPKKHRCLCTYADGFVVDYKTWVSHKDEKPATQDLIGTQRSSKSQFHQNCSVGLLFLKLLLQSISFQNEDRIHIIFSWIQSCWAILEINQSKSKCGVVVSRYSFLFVFGLAVPPERSKLIIKCELRLKGTVHPKFKFSFLC